MGETLDKSFITVVVPIRNEERFIAQTIGMLLEQDYPRDRFEIVVVDGMSDDRTRAIVEELAAIHPQILLLDNPGKRSSLGRNVGFRAGRGDYFLLIDGHCYIPSRQLLNDINEGFQKNGVDCLGRPQPLDPPGLSSFQRLIALARASWLGHGADSLIYSDYEGFASPTSNGAAYTAEVFEKIGYVDETFDACEDVEFNYRVERAGLKCFTSPKFTVRYFPRESFSALYKQMNRYGLGRALLLQKHPETFSLPALAPAAISLVFLLLPVFALLFAKSLATTTLGLICLVYLLLLLVETVGVCRKSLSSDFDWRVPAIFATVHAGLGMGMLTGMGKKLISSLKQHWKRKRTVDGGKCTIAFVIDRIDSPKAGTEGHLTRLIDRLDKNRFTPILCVLEATQYSEAFDACRVYTVDLHSFKRPTTYAKILRFSSFLRQEGIDIVQTYFTDANKVGILAGRLAGVNTVISTRRNQGYWHTRAELFVLKLLNPLVTLFLANSESTGRWVVQTEKVAARKVKMIHNGVEIDPQAPKGDPTRVELRSSWGVTTDGFVVGIVANLRPVKRVDLFLKAAALVAEQLGNTSFVIIGDGDERNALEEQASALGIGGKVHFMGSREDVSTLLRGFDAGVLTSDSESSSNSVLEYMAASLPVVATRVGAIDEIIVEGYNGFIVDTGDAKGLAENLLRIRTEGLGRAMGERNLELIRTSFTLDKMVSNFEDLYSSLLEPTKSSYAQQ